MRLAHGGMRHHWGVLSRKQQRREPLERSRWLLVLGVVDDQRQRGVHSRQGVALPARTACVRADYPPLRAFGALIHRVDFTDTGGNVAQDRQANLAHLAGAVKQQVHATIQRQLGDIRWANPCHPCAQTIGRVALVGMRPEVRDEWAAVRWPQIHVLSGAVFRSWCHYNHVTNEL